jgi:RNA polymerase sigma factor (TIGR02999 family)
MKEDSSNSIATWFPSVYGELRELAHHHLFREAHNATLNTTALVHEAYLKLEKQLEEDRITRQQFFGMASQAMRRILIDFARARLREKRGGGQIMLTHRDDQWVRETTPEQLLALDEAMEKLSTLNKRQCQVIEFWFFAGFKQEEIAQILDISLASVRRDWRLGRAWLSRELKNQNHN